ncbi:siroheme synthase CysG [Roseiarcaceae bacterium H3SJ34-1]|uniref:siroheme synthase CysG n=1 Tax=Terripilifer ovatus TaxID=3032367 RepID=UPI003AB9205B|nr:siroheme synthase CysG [Roseiarcaceae bacterium H3SJ34-1]
MSDSAPARIQPLATLPLFHKLSGATVLLAGRGEAAVDALAWKADLFTAAGAHVIEVDARAWCDDDFAGVRLAVGAFEDVTQAGAFASAARRHGVPVNIIDRPEFCDFQFGSIVNRSPLVVAISTDGAAPIFAQAIRAKIEALLPTGFAHWVAAAKLWRAQIPLRQAGSVLRRGFWTAYAALAFAQPHRRPADEDFDTLLEQAGSPAAKRAGRVSLVGAGPGNPELLTLKAVRLLQSADIILYDHLVSPEILDFARREARRMLVGKTGYGPSCKQDDINALMVSFARDGKHVVRLKGGDPGIFGRAGEEISACRDAGLAVEIVPGITTAQGAAADLGISLTHRDHAQRVQFVTGHARSGALPKSICWEALADSDVTTVVYMPRKTLSGLRDAAMAAGLDPNMPAAAVFSATRGNSHRIIATIATLPEQLEGIDEDGPVVVMIGSVLSEVEMASAGIPVVTQTDAA